jgi:rubredoxin
VMRAVKAGWRLDKSKVPEEWTCPGCAAVARSRLDAAIREERLRDDG